MTVPVVTHNGVYPHASFARRKTAQGRVLDWGGWIAVGIILAGLFVFAVALLLGAFWLLLQVLDALARRLGG